MRRQLPVVGIREHHLHPAVDERDHGARRLRDDLAVLDAVRSTVGVDDQAALRVDRDHGRAARWGRDVRRRDRLTATHAPLLARADEHLARLSRPLRIGRALGDAAFVGGDRRLGGPVNDRDVDLERGAADRRSRCRRPHLVLGIAHQEPGHDVPGPAEVLRHLDDRRAARFHRGRVDDKRAARLDLDGPA